MSDALPIRSHPDLDRYKELAEDLQRACRSADSGAMGAWAVGWLETLARLEGADPAAAERRAAIAYEARRIQERWRTFINDEIAAPAACSPMPSSSSPASTGSAAGRRSRHTSRR